MRTATKNITGDFVWEEAHDALWFYSSSHHALYMNIATGGGTLVHEIVTSVHGLKLSRVSVVVQRRAGVALRAIGRTGRTYHRTDELAAARLTISNSQRDVPPFATLCQTTTREFYDKDKGTNYSRPATYATTCRSGICCRSSTGRFARTRQQTRLGSSHSNRSSANEIWTSFKQKWESRSPEAAISTETMRASTIAACTEFAVACRLSPGCIESFNRVGIAPRVRLGLLSTKSEEMGLMRLYGSHRSWREVAGLSHARGDAHAVKQEQLTILGRGWPRPK